MLSRTGSPTKPTASGGSQSRRPALQPSVAETPQSIEGVQPSSSTLPMLVDYQSDHSAPIDKDIEMPPAEEPLFLPGSDNEHPPAPSPPSPSELPPRFSPHKRRRVESTSTSTQTNEPEVQPQALGPLVLSHVSPPPRSPKTVSSTFQI